MTGAGATPARLTASAPAPRLSRAALVARILADTAPIIVIEAPAGTGKSWLLDDLARATGLAVAQGEMAPAAAAALWDIPAVAVSGPLPERCDRLILAKRPETAVPGLARARVYGRVHTIDAADLMFDAPALSALPAALDIWRRTGGWPCLLPAALGARAGTGALAAFLRDDILAPMSSAQLVALQVALADPGAAVDPAMLRGVPFTEAGTDPLHPALVACRQPLLRALRTLLVLRAREPHQARAIAVAQAAQGRLPEAIATFQAIGAWQAALQTLRQGHGLFFIHIFGSEAFDAVLAGFPADLAQGDETLVLCRAIQAIKRGEVPLMQRILIDRFGPVAIDATAVLADRNRFSRDVRFTRLLLRTWEDFDLDQQLLGDAYELLAELPADDDLQRGSFHNAVLEFYIRDRRFAEADHTAVRAMRHYDKAGVPILSFYIDLHRAIIQLFLGNPGSARQHAVRAAAHLRAARYDSPGDARLLALLGACIDYEQGRAETLTRFLTHDLDDLAQGEIWPSLIELALTYGSQALGEHVSTLAARSFLDRWRVMQDRSRQFGMLIDIREVVVMQNGNRWQEAAQKAEGLASRITLDWMQEASAGLGALQDRDEVALALVWLRHMAQMTPTRPGLDRQLAVLLDNPHLTARQRTGAEIWLAHVLRRQRHPDAAQRRLAATLGAAATLGSIAILAEERVFLADLMANRRIREAIERSDALRRVLRQVQDTGPGRAPQGRALGLTRQETRILLALAEGAANKAVAKTMGLSEATVKFHLSNLYRKLGCRSRREAVAAAVALGLVR